MSLSTEDNIILSNVISAKAWH